ncbi:MFS transporter [Massilia sp. CF038]|uniref:MFS transporter n=1 Tax=Massilia sp. CF038 TaxID=1881045 RepID=UPI00091D1194|nr:MFS transporter [Massilia sp. CF038]SHH07052.1 Predicted arabinose efflux permease, MFS family [Massilia sp. CF038]
MQTPERAVLLREPNFRWLMAGGLISALGDQFTLIALPWLVLTTTGNALQLGLVIALMSIPRALFILVGGALVDRYSPKSVLMLSKFANAILLAILTALVFAGQVSMPAIYVLAFGLGLASAFAIPSGTSMLPHVVAPAQLPMANGVMMGMRQLTMLSGPLLAALVFALWGDGSSGQPGAAHGIGIAFAFDCISFVVSAWTLNKVRTHAAPPQAAAEGVWQAIGAGLTMVWRDMSLRVCIMYWALCAFIVGGTMQVALPVLAESRLGGAAALGLIMGLHGAGSLLGMGISGASAKLKWVRMASFGSTILVVDAIAGALLMGMAVIRSTWQAGAFMLLLGLLTGFIQVAVFSWIQQRVPRAMLGRAMSIFMFIFMGLAPLAAAITGALLAWLSLTGLFIGAGAFLLAAASVAFLFTPMPRITHGTAID